MYLLAVGLAVLAWYNWARLDSIFETGFSYQLAGSDHYEALSGELQTKPVIFMLKVKCPAIARETGLDTGTTVIKLEGGARRTISG